MASSSPLLNACTTIFVTGLPTIANDADVRSLFSSYGRVTHVKINCLRGKPNGTAQVRFRSPVAELQPGTLVTLMDHTVNVRQLPNPIVKPVVLSVAEENLNSSTTPVQPAQAARSPPEDAASSTPLPAGGEGQPVPSAASCPKVDDRAVKEDPSHTASPFSSETQAESATPSTSVVRDESPELMYDKLPPLPDAFCASSSDDDS
ncbi:hypothetical protein ABB37_02061 [Leptomonas pyrrhocoris]|uniref:RRM domain-containing protein n=1 Tax=Leptomonas pyrrhocoris TaxID=157538 RepID=A0A0M9G7D6_LEPPY|nr:hypothetical protein ABB37_02061 [Leptomonas pyrrhocoris]XP_015662309.1 hypothetical protein ABB37_02061 [Leptomonas pyrrhocoris]XP_015662310.1 hypothetical protein ABB37_02061 [Leptomonas pyrrhocoris]KPA83869.1 hypothetical protein ABB37_02061 [Leptomonas pyrrhocoris]KPA83870.1 hypothetical protein ABB37_02061 [Leptomonas pyrrhocoris]KPA83871.1 hypothetical protein ABB37_02061 [Leptomonas pyrrhocoris]|eukprot:XP_015662308.1 hypothetical protein ABB37_02061 [Leptomonas pyrrhocoris]